MTTKQKAKCKKFIMLTGSPNFYSIMCGNEGDRPQQLVFSKAAKNERDETFEKFCCSDKNCKKCSLYTI